MWCKNSSCCHYDKTINKCTRIGKCGVNKNKLGVCWMDKLEGEY